MQTPPPQIIGRYEIVEPLATGGMATVYLARLSGPGGFTKLFALKTIHPHLIAEDGFIEMFLDEARIASRIAHPNVCQIIDFGVGTGSYFIAMELLLGENLAKLQPELKSASSGERHVELVARIVADAAEGLHAAHEVTDDDGKLLHVVHRDISQSNLLVTFDGVVKVVDFGIASAADQLHLTRTGTLKGKFAYMAPEQLEQERVDRRADIWSLGVVLWELLAGRRLFKRPRQVDSMRAVLDAPIPLASAVNPDVPPEMDAILARALDRTPEARYPTALELARALDELAAARGWTLSARELGEQVRRMCADSFERQSAMVGRARSGPAPEPEPKRAAPPVDLTQTRQARPLATAAKLDRETPADSPKRRRWTTILALASVAGIAAAAYFAGAQAGPADQVLAATGTPTLASPSIPVALDPAPADVAMDIANDIPPDTTEADANANAAEPIEIEMAVPVAVSMTSGEMMRRRAPGFVNITTPGGWADVIIGGRNVGRTPLRTRLPAGRRRVVLRPFGRGSIRRSVVVRPREAARLVVPVQAP